MSIAIAARGGFEIRDGCLCWGRWLASQIGSIAGADTGGRLGYSQRARIGLTSFSASSLARDLIREPNDRRRFRGATIRADHLSSASSAVP